MPAAGRPDRTAADVPAAPAVGPRSTTADVLRAAIADGTSRLVAHDPGVRSGDDPEEVHQARVATRRLRSDLGTFRPALDPPWTAKLRHELGWLGGLLGTVRDGDVLLGRLREQASRLAAGDAKPAAALLRRLEAEREQARAVLLEALDGPRYPLLLDALMTAAAAPPLRPAGKRPAGDTLPTLVGDRWRNLGRAVAGLGPRPGDPELHRVRILAKRCRYAAEAAAPVAGKDVRRLAEALAGVQAVLGELNDAVVAEAWLRQVSRRAPAGQALVAGELIAAERERACAVRVSWPGAWTVAERLASAKRLRAWLGS